MTTLLTSIVLLVACATLATATYFPGSYGGGNFQHYHTHYHQPQWYGYGGGYGGGGFGGGYGGGFGGYGGGYGHGFQGFPFFGFGCFYGDDDGCFDG